MRVRDCEYVSMRSEIGGSEFVVKPAPYQEIDFDCACVWVARVRASVAAWARTTSGVAGRGQVQFVGVVCPAGFFRSRQSHAKTTPLSFPQHLF